jgi:hypothetical protein
MRNALHSGCGGATLQRSSRMLAAAGARDASRRRQRPRRGNSVSSFTAVARGGVAAGRGRSRRIQSQPVADELIATRSAGVLLLTARNWMTRRPRDGERRC